MVFPSSLGARFSHAFFRHDLIHFYSFKANLRSVTDPNLSLWPQRRSSNRLSDLPQETGTQHIPKLSCVSPLAQICSCIWNPFPFARIKFSIWHIPHFSFTFCLSIHNASLLEHFRLSEHSMPFYICRFSISCAFSQEGLSKPSPPGNHLPPSKGQFPLSSVGCFWPSQARSLFPSLCVSGI